MPPIEPEQFSFAASSSEEVHEVLSLFFPQAHEKIRLMQQAATRKEYEGWKSAAHCLRGSAANLGMHRLAETCRLAELTPAFSPAEAAALLDVINSELARVKTYFNWQA